MQVKNRFILAAVVVTSMSSAASAATIAAATMPLNIRSGPGPEYNVVGAIPMHAQAAIIGCMQGSLWCQVSYNGKQGWSYSQYLMATLSGRSLAVAETINTMPAVTYQAPPATVGAAVQTAPRITGTLIVPPAAASIVLNPPKTVQSYVASHPVAPVYLNGEVVEGVGLPEDVALNPVPGYDYDYAYVNSVPVLVEPSTRRVEYVYR